MDDAVAEGAFADGFVEDPAPEGAADSTPVELGAATAPEAMMTCGSDPEPLHAQMVAAISANGIHAGDFPLFGRGPCGRRHDEKRDGCSSCIVGVLSLSAFL